MECNHFAERSQPEQGLQPDLAERSQTQESHTIRQNEAKRRSATRNLAERSQPEAVYEIWQNEANRNRTSKFGRTKPNAGGLHIIRLNEAKRAGQSRTCLAERTHHCWRFKSTVLNLVDH